MKSDEEISKEIGIFVIEQEPKVLLKKTGERQHISAVVYNGSSETESSTIYAYIKYYYDTKKPLTLMGSDCSVIVENIDLLASEDFPRNRTIYKVVLKGQLI